MNRERPIPLVVLISGSGSNLQALIDAIREGHLPAEIRAVISNRADAFGLERARNAGIETRVLDHRAYSDREAYDRDLAALVEGFQPRLVILAGFMRILTPAFVNRFHGRMLNIHPSLLPRYRGLHTHERVLEAGDREHGASVHYVTEELDGGPVIMQARVPVEPGDDPETLAARVLGQEHVIYPAVIRLIAGNRVRLEEGGRVTFDGKPLETPITLGWGETPPR
ncbi:MAG TPA: phosphoribosylglycinamide formyltransferase [Sedimenticola sp.]|nr:phosphoribosylglycinamide formyltransferase [Sedimenticola sp.]